MSRLILLTFALLGGCARPAPPADAGAPAALPADAPTAEALFQAAAAALGAPDALAAVRSTAGRGVVQIQAQGIVAGLTLAQVAPGDLRTALDFPGVGLMEEGVYQGVAWALDPMGGPRIKQGVEAAQAVRAAAMDLEWNLGAYFPQAETVALDALNGEPVWVVRATPAEGPEELLYFRVSDGLHVGGLVRYSTLMGEFATQMSFSDHREIDGVKFAFLSTISQGPVTSQIQMSEVLLNPAEPPNVAPPDEIQALIAAGTP